MDHFAGMHYRVEREAKDVEPEVAPVVDAVRLARSRFTPPWVAHRRLNEAMRAGADDTVKILDRDGTVVRAFPVKDRDAGFRLEHEIVDALLRMELVPFRMKYGIPSPQSVPGAAAAAAGAAAAVAATPEGPPPIKPAAEPPAAIAPPATIAVPAGDPNRAAAHYRVERRSTVEVNIGKVKGGKTLSFLLRRKSTPKWIRDIEPELKRLEQLPPEIADAMGLPTAQDHVVQIATHEGKVVYEEHARNATSAETIQARFVDDVLKMDVASFRAKYRIEQA